MVRDARLRSRFGGLLTMRARVVAINRRENKLIPARSDAFIFTAASLIEGVF